MICPEVPLENLQFDGPAKSPSTTWFVESLRSSRSLGPTLTLMLCETFARNRFGDQATVSVRHGNSARPPTSSTFCNVRLAGEPNVQVTVRDASGFVTTIGASARAPGTARSEEHTSELQSRQYLVCRLLLEKKNNTT